MGRIVNRAKRTAIRGSSLASRWMSQTPLSRVVLVEEFPKSGGTWVAKILAQSLGVPYVEDSLVPVVRPSVLRVHWVPAAGGAVRLPLVRDGRDVMVSLFHHRIRRLQLDPVSNRTQASRFREPLDASRIREQMPWFIETEFDEPTHGVRLSWSNYVLRQLGSGEGGPLVRYEDMLNDPVAVIGRFCLASGLSTNEKKIAAAVEAHDRSKAPRTGSASSVLRSGTAGEWESVFSAEASEAFWSRSRAAMEALGYV